MMLTRRSFLLSASAAVVSTALPFPVMSHAVAVTEATEAPKLFAFAVGTPGEYDWHSVFAKSAEDAFKQWAWDRGDCEEEEDPAFDPDYVHRVEIWDDLLETEINPAQWFAAGMGHMCERCNFETHPEMGGEVVNGEVVCEDCLGLSDILVIDRDRALEALIEQIIDHGADEAAARLTSKGHWPKITPDLWAEAISEAASA